MIFEAFQWLKFNQSYSDWSFIQWVRKSGNSTYLLLENDVLILEKKRYFIRNGHKILKNPPKSIIHDYGVIGYFLKSWNWILEYYKTHWIQNHSDSFKLRLIQVLELENFSKSRKKRMWYSIWQWPEFSRGKNIICPLENRILIRFTIAQFISIHFYR